MGKVRVIVYSASELGACTKYLVAQRLGYEPPPAYQDSLPDFFALGHELEQETLTWLQSRGWTITATQPEYYIAAGRSSAGEELVIRCHPDALATTDTGQNVAVEIKSCADDAFNDYNRNGFARAGGLFPRYHYQVSCYASVTQLPVAFVLRNKEVGKDGRVSRSIDVLEPSALLPKEKLLARVQTIEKLADSYDIPRDCDYPNFYCPLSYLHESVVEIKADSDLDDMIREYKRLQQAQEKHKSDTTKQRLKIRAAILKHMGLDPTGEQEGPLTRLHTGRTRATAVWGATGYTSYDWKQMRLDGIEVDKYKKEPTKGWRLMTWVLDNSADTDTETGDKD